VTTVPVVALLGRSFIATLDAGVFASHATAQRRYARLHATRTVVRPERGALASVDVIIPVWNEDPELLEACCQSLLAQDYPISVFLVDDCSRNLEALEPLYDRYGQRPDWTVVILKEHVGKRQAQDAAYQRGTGEFVLTIDSDTVVYADTIQKLIDRVQYDDVGAVTGNVRALNQSKGTLAEAINWRYAMLFDQERAAQGWHGAVLCCTGPLSLYRRAALEEVWEDYLTQTFRGLACVFGDDLQLTNLLLARGYESRYAPDAHALTEVPTRLGRYFRQQVRWNRSFFRELPWTRRALRGRRRGHRSGLYLWFDVIARGAAPLLLAGGMALGVRDLAVARSLLLADAAMLAVMTGTRAALVLWQTRNLPEPDPALPPDRRAAMAPPSGREAIKLVVVYGLIHAGLLVPARLWALATLHKNGWGTRGGTHETAPAALAPTAGLEGLAG
jgi:N-acetylglucosaminyltransferase